MKAILTILVVLAMAGGAWGEDGRMVLILNNFDITMCKIPFIGTVIYYPETSTRAARIEIFHDKPVKEPKTCWEYTTSMNSFPNILENSGWEPFAVSGSVVYFKRPIPCEVKP